MSGKAIVREKYMYKNESFDKLLAHMLSEMTDDQKSKLPPDLVYKIFKSKDPNVNLLSDAQKDYILNTSFNKKIVKFILDEEKGLSIEQFFALKDVWRKKKGKEINASVLAEQLCFEGEFVLADKDLYDAVSYAALVCYSPVFKVIVNRRPVSKRAKQPNREFFTMVHNFMNMLVHYESYKRRFIMEFGLEGMSEWYCLIYFYTGEKKGSSIYLENFKYGYSTGEQKLKAAMTRLKNLGFLSARGSKKNNFVSTTPSGRMLVDKILTKYILNY